LGHEALDLALTAFIQGEEILIPDLVIFLIADHCLGGEYLSELKPLLIITQINSRSFFVAKIHLVPKY